MPRNYENEKAWLKEKYTRIDARIDKELGIQLKEKLKEENKSLATWITEKAREYRKQ